MFSPHLDIVSYLSLVAWYNIEVEQEGAFTLPTRVNTRFLSEGADGKTRFIHLLKALHVRPLV